MVSRLLRNRMQKEIRLNQRSQKLGPPTLEKNEDFKENIKQICLFFKTIEFLNHIFFLIFYAAPETL